MLRDLRTGVSTPRGAPTERELDVVGLLGQGLSNKGIAERLSISPATAQHHTSSIYAKLEVREDPSLNRRMCAVNAARRSVLIQNVRVTRAREPREDWRFQ
ncbi:MAG: LuxR C-terminal-related transcriptional regulator [Chloroflexota bacterium]|nr:LuxR C-terminal-related transcriptional regulator [Chloroflexota bacterium]